MAFGHLLRMPLGELVGIMVAITDIAAHDMYWLAWLIVVAIAFACCCC